MDNYVRIFDTTLRDGEQSPGATLTSDEKLEVARALSRLGVDVIEAGFPAASPDDLAAVQRIAETVGRDVPEGRPERPGGAEPPIICGLARATEKDIDQAFAGVRGAKHPRIHTFLATSPIHREHKLRMTKEQVVERASKMVAYARALCADVEFSPEDAGRTEPEFLYEVLSAVIEAGATTLNIPDTVGYTLPHEFGELIAGIMSNVKGIEKAIVSVHCHDDLGLATVNSLAGIRAGARQAEVTINGIGERAGNTSLEEVVMTLATRKPIFGLRTGIDTTQLTRTSKLVSARTGMVVQPNKAIVGANAFAHESGIHQDGMLKHQETYEIMKAEDVGWGANKMVMGKHSGRAAFRSRLNELGVTFETDAALNEAFARFKELADKKHEIFDEDLQALATEAASETAADVYRLVALESHSIIGETPAAEVVVSMHGEEKRCKAEGSGPVDATFKAIEEVANSNSDLLLYSVNAITKGTDSQGEVTVRLEKGGRIVNGSGADTDIIVASAKAYIHALNLLVSDANRKHPQGADI